jgi:RNase H-fold protein (predicted Holliday junction resolvase)
MGDLVNLRRARKSKQRDERDKTAEANRRLFGRTRAEKESEAARRDLAARNIDAHKRDRD